MSLWLDSYDNIFSDFDPRPYSQRTLSDDFLDEVRKVTHEAKPGELEITFLVPQGQKNANMEHIIRSRLHMHFRHEFGRLAKERKSTLSKGVLLAAIGSLFIVGATAAASLQENDILLNFVRVLLEPSGWFTAWYGLDLIFYESRAEAKKLRFYKKMTKAEMAFDVYRPNI